MRIPFFFTIAIFSAVFPLFQGHRGKKKWALFYLPVACFAVSVPLYMMGGVTRLILATIVLAYGAYTLWRRAQGGLQLEAVEGHDLVEELGGEFQMSEWADDIFNVLIGAGVRQVAYVPDMGHKRLIERCNADERMTAVLLTTEEEGVALLAGSWLGGELGVLLMQSSGIGNCINMFSLTRSCELPLLMLVTMRGQWHEFNPWQKPMGRNAKKLLTTAGFDVEVVSEPGAAAETVAEAAEGVFKNNGRVAVLLHQKLMPKKTFGK